MPFAWPLDKLAVINSALALTGDNLVPAANDGSDEWTVASAAYDRAIAYAMESHSWGYATLVVTLQPSPTQPSDTDWDTAYPIPQDLVHTLWLKVNQDTTDAQNTVQAAPALYDIMVVGGVPCFVLNAQGGPPPPQPPVAPAFITCKYISNSGALCDVQNGTPTFVVALQDFTMAGIYNGLHEDGQRADQLWTQAEKMLQAARSRYDQQKPKRQLFNSRIAAARRLRRPWPPIGIDNWSNSNTPGQ